MPRLVGYFAALAAVVALAGCATTPSVGSKKWHDSRIVEIESAYEAGEVSEAEYLALKNEADQTRVEHQENMRRHLEYRRTIGFYRHHHFHIHHH